MNEFVKQRMTNTFKGEIVAENEAERLGECVDKPPGPTEKRNVSTVGAKMEIALRSWMREITYRQRVLNATGYQLGQVKQLAVMYAYLLSRRRLVASIRELMRDSVYQIYNYRQLVDMFYNMERGEVLYRVWRVHRGRKVIMWGLTAVGREMVEKYLSWMVGEHDDEINW